MWTALLAIAWADVIPPPPDDMDCPPGSTIREFGHGGYECAPTATCEGECLDGMTCAEVQYCERVITYKIEGGGRMYISEDELAEMPDKTRVVARACDGTCECVTRTHCVPESSWLCGCSAVGGAVPFAWLLVVPWVRSARSRRRRTPAPRRR